MQVRPRCVVPGCMEEARVGSTSSGCLPRHSLLCTAWRPLLPTFPCACLWCLTYACAAAAAGCCRYPFGGKAAPWAAHALVVEEQARPLPHLHLCQRGRPGQQ